MTIKPMANCFLCGEEAELKYIEFAEWVCDKDYDKIMRFLSRAKKRKSRYSSPKTFCGAHNLGDKT